jgi:hypothetical protein
MKKMHLDPLTMTLVPSRLKLAAAFSVGKISGG